jgi:5-methylcytosine-specific restriction endonuclease McrA
MFRKNNTTRYGGAFSAQIKKSVWLKAIPVAGRTDIRLDRCGAIIQWGHYGNINSPYGWEIDHIVPVSRMGSDLLSNLQPLQWQNNRHKADNYPGVCKVTARH